MGTAASSCERPQSSPASSGENIKTIVVADGNNKNKDAASKVRRPSDAHHHCAVPKGFTLNGEKSSSSLATSSTTTGSHPTASSLNGGGVGGKCIAKTSQIFVNSSIYDQREGNEEKDEFPNSSSHQGDLFYHPPPQPPREKVYTPSSLHYNHTPLQYSTATTSTPPLLGESSSVVSRTSSAAAASRGGGGRLTPRRSQHTTSHRGGSRTEFKSILTDQERHDAESRRISAALRDSSFQVSQSRSIGTANSKTPTPIITGLNDGTTYNSNTQDKDEAEISPLIVPGGSSFPDPPPASAATLTPVCASTSGGGIVRRVPSSSIPAMSKPLPTSIFHLTPEDGISTMPSESNTPLMSIKTRNDGVTFGGGTASTIAAGGGDVSWERSAGVEEEDDLGEDSCPIREVLPLDVDSSPKTPSIRRRPKSVNT